MTFFCTEQALQPSQQLVIVFNRLHFTGFKNRDYADAFLGRFTACKAANLAPTRQERRQKYCQPRTAAETDVLRPIFDFSGPPARVFTMLPLLESVRSQLPEACVFYHHGELVSVFSLSERCNDVLPLVPLIDRFVGRCCRHRHIQHCFL